MNFGMCGRWRNGRLASVCTMAGSEECDFECPHRDAPDTVEDVEDPAYPRFFVNTGRFTSDALYVRFDDPERDAVVVTATGERPPHHTPWLLVNCLLMVQVGKARELTADEARAIAPHGVPPSEQQASAPSHADAPKEPR